ncbi:MAG: hypothetical protein QOE20_5633, partial [Mycobacterium sp.]|nr:hypothetical protein [Mycobacterium sp.]
FAWSSTTLSVECRCTGFTIGALARADERLGEFPDFLAQFVELGGGGCLTLGVPAATLSTIHDASVAVNTPSRLTPAIMSATATNLPVTVWGTVSP